MQQEPTLPTVSERFAGILGDLARVVQAKRSEGGFFLAVAMVIWSRVMGVSRDVVALIRAIEAGVVRPYVARPRPKGAGKRVVPEGVRARLVALGSVWCRMPKRVGWLVAKGGWQVAAFQGQLEYLLRDPEMQRLLAANPRLGRAMRPVCRMLGVDPKLYENVEAPAEVVQPEAVAAPLAVAPPDAEAPAEPLKNRVERENVAGIPWWQQKWAQ